MKTEGRKYRIMVLDDLKNNLEGAKRGLSQYGEIVTAGNYVEGVKLIENYRPDLAFIDLNFPYDKGSRVEELGYRLREEVLNPGIIPNAIVTAGDHGGTGHDVKIYTNIPVEEIDPIEGYSFGGGGGNPVFKSSAESWNHAYEILMGKNMPENREAIQCYLEAIKIFRDSHGR